MPENIEEMRFQFEKETADREFKIKEDELSLRREEMKARAEAENNSKHWSSSPISTTIIVALFGLLGTGLGLVIQGYQNAKLEREKFDFTKQIEKQKSESDLVLKVIETGDPEKAQKNLLFLVKSGLITDAEGKIETQAINLETVPVLSKPGNNDLFTLDEAKNWDTSLSLDSTVINEVINIAKSQIGVKENPSGSNEGKEINEYLESVGLSKGLPWQQAFVYWCFNESSKKIGATNPIPKTAGVLDLLGRSQRRKIPLLSPLLAQSKPNLIKPGMIFVIDTGDSGGAGHSGIVEKVYGDEILTIEGNTNIDDSSEGIGIFSKTRKISSINGGFLYFGKE